MTSPVSDLPVAVARLESNLSHGGFDVHVCAHRSPGGVDILHPIVNPVIQHVPHGTYYAPTPAFTLTHQSAQALLDALWSAGFRPASGDKGGANLDLLLQSHREHLADLRRAAFGLDEVRSPDAPATADATY